MRFHFTIREMLLVLTIVSLGLAWWSDHQNLESFLTASNPTEPIEFRVAAMSQLTDADRNRLLSLLFEQLPEHWDLAGMNAIQLLGEVGDAETVDVLKRMEALRNHLPFSTDGRFTGKLAWSIAKILARLPEGERSKQLDDIPEDIRGLVMQCCRQ